MSLPSISPNGQVRQLTKAEGRALLGQEACRYLNMSAQEFIDAWEQGQFGDNPDQPDVTYVAMLLLKAIRSGKCRLWGLYPIPITLFFEGLHGRVWVFLTTTHAPAFRKAFGAYLTVSSLDSHFTLPPKQAIEVLSVEDRLEFMLFLSWWFDQRPKEFRRLDAEVELR